MYNKTFLYIVYFLFGMVGFGIAYITDLNEVVPIIPFIVSIIIAMLGLVTMWYRTDIGKFLLVISAFMFFLFLISYMWLPTSYLWQTH